MSLITQLSSEFTSAVRSRGDDYFQEGRVRITTGSRWEVRAKVRGNRAYDVHLQIAANEIFVYCSCLDFDREPCKHLWATILAVEEKGYLSRGGARGPLEMIPGLDDDDLLEDDEDWEDLGWMKDDDGESPFPTLFKPGSGAASKENMPSWKEQLAALGRKANSAVAGVGNEWPPTRRIVYLVDVFATIESQHLILDTLIQDLKQNGEWGKPRKQRMPRWQITNLPEASDRQIFAMLAGSREQSDYNYYGYDYQDAYDTAPSRHRLTSPLPQIILPLIVKTGRCYLKPEVDSDEMSKIEWDEGEPWRFLLQIRRDHNKSDQYIVEGVLRRGEERFNLSKAALMLEGGLIFTKQKVGELDDGGAFHWISILRRAGAIFIPEAQIGEFLNEVLSETRPPRLDMPEDLKFEEINVKPQPCLTFKSQKQNARLRARLAFDYAPDSQGCILEKDDPRRGIYQVENRRYILRDRNAEAACVRRLTEAGLKSVRPTYYEKQVGWEVAPTKLPRVVRELVAEGWRIEAEGKIFRRPGDIKVQVNSGIDWFELHSSVNFGDTTAALPELLAALKRGDNVIKLDDGTYGMLPEDWLRKYGALAGLGEAHEDHLRFRKTQVGVLNALLNSQPEASFDETFARAAQELKRFEGVKPADPPDGFKGELRPYQKDGLGWINFLRQFGFGGCLADDMGLGKCIAADSLIFINGELIAAKDVWNKYARRAVSDGCGDWATPATELLTNSICELNGRITQTRVLRLYRQHVKENLRRVILADGSRITITRRHRLLTDKGWTNDFREGDYVCVPAKLLWDGKPQDQDLIKFLAWQIAEGYESDSSSELRITHKEFSVLNELRECLLRIEEKFGFSLNPPPIDAHRAELKVFSEEFKEFLESLGYHLGSDEKSLPSFIMQADEDSARIFLRNYFEAGASIKDSIRGVEIRVESPKLIQQVSSLLRRFGVWMRVSERQERLTDGSRIRYFSGSIAGEAALNFCLEIGFNDPKKQFRLERICQDNSGIESLSATRVTEGILSHAVSPIMPFGLRNSSFHEGSGYDRNYPPKGVIGWEVFYSEIMSVEDVVYEGWVYDFEIEEHHNFVANNILCHNTIQILAVLESRRELREDGKIKSGKNATAAAELIVPPPSLVIVPKSLVFNWKQEAARFAPKLRVLDHTGHAREKQSTEHFDNYDLILTTYGTLRNDAVLFKDKRFDYVILDEAQAIKNADTASAKATRLLNGDNRLALSGTPVENHLGELWSLFEFLNPGMLGAASSFKFGGGIGRSVNEETQKMLAHALRPFILRRTKKQVAKDLPEKLEQTIFCELDPAQRKLYNELRDHYRNTLLARVAREGVGKSKIQALEALLRLRQAALHPGLIDQKRVNEDSAKLDLLVPKLLELFEEDHKVLVFSQFTSFLSILRKKLDEEKLDYEYLDGSTRNRQARVERFQNDPNCKLFLISLKAGGLGLNLTAAEYVYLLDPWWNPAVESQAIDRAHRIGQTRQVFAYRIIARDTVEEKVLALQGSKRDLADAIINADNSLIRNLSKEDLELLLS